MQTPLAICRIGTISTLGASGEGAGYPTGSVVQFAADDSGRPIFAFSSLSGHTRDLRSDPRCSLTVSSPTFRVRACASTRRCPEDFITNLPSHQAAHEPIG